MKSFNFPDMFNSNSSNIIEDIGASTNDLILLLSTEKGTFTDDPDFGLRLKKYLFEQNNYILKDIIIDEIYTQVALFCPQIKINRKDIKIIQDQEKGKLYCRFKALNQKDFKTLSYQLVLYDENK